MRLKALVACLGVLAGVSEAGAQSGSFTKAIDNWSQTNGVAVTSEVRNQLASQTAKAVETVKQRQPSVSATRLQELAPEAAVAYLDLSQKGASVPALAVLLEGIATGHWLYGGLGAPTEYPILYVDVAPQNPRILSSLSMEPHFEPA
jgi:hypothetical protein